MKLAAPSNRFNGFVIFQASVSTDAEGIIVNTAPRMSKLAS